MSEMTARKHEESAAAPPAAGAKEERPKGKGWIDWIAVTTAALAVITAFASAELAKNSNAALRLTNQETDQWSFYQSKSIKEHTYRLQAELLTLLPQAPELEAAREKARSRYQAETGRYEGEKKEIEAKARLLADGRMVAMDHAGRCTRALIALQIAIVLSSVAGITKKRWLYFSGLILGVLGTGLFGWGAFW